MRIVVVLMMTGLRVGLLSVVSTNTLIIIFTINLTRANDSSRIKFYFLW